MSQERAFIETLLGQRFNFFLVFFSLVIAGAINAKSQFHFQVVLTIGAIISCLLARVLARTQQKLDLIITDLFTDSRHPIAVIDVRCGPGSVRGIIGFTIPRISCAVLALGAALSWFGVIQSSSQPAALQTPAASPAILASTSTPRPAATPTPLPVPAATQPTATPLPQPKP